ncbi:MAG: dihydroorotase family protein [Thaumarchaeota archaeon]|nr:dihydroorotase family protein [Nitrososphaerota archaeon]
MTVDLVIRNGRVLLPDGLLEAGIAVNEEKVVLVAKEPSLPKADKTIDASGKIVVPGLVDTHSHFREPGYTHKEDFLTGTKAAAAGGVTLAVDMPNCEPPTNSARTLEEKKKLAQAKAVVDFGHFVFPTLDEIPAIAEAGALGYKIFMVKGEYPHDPRICIDDHGKMLATLQAVAKTGLPCLIHPCNMEVFDELSRQAWAQGKKDWITFGQVYVNDLVYSTAITTLLLMAKQTAVKMHLLHTHSLEGIRAIRRAKQDGVNVSAQVDPKYFIITREELDRLGPKALPAGLIGQERVQAVWDALNDGTIDVLATDHAPHTVEEVNTALKDPWIAPFGCPQLEHYLSIMLTEVKKGKISLERLMTVCSEAPAKMIGLYPQKGSIRIGSDADFTVIDLHKRKKITNDKVYTKCGWTPYEGREVEGQPVFTIVRGNIVMEDGEVVGKPGSGRLTTPKQHVSK